MNTDRPLAGLKVLDLTSLLPGPLATLILADLGAEVVHVEAPKRLDMMRAFVDGCGDSPAYRFIGRGKRHITLNLKRPEGQEALRRLLEQYDILIEGFRPGVMAKFGLAYEDLQKDFPQLIYASLTGYGQTGPYADRAGHDINYQAVSGLASYCGREQSGPVPTGVPIADIACGSWPLVVGVLAAYIERLRSGEGQLLDISMTDMAFFTHGIFGANALSGEPLKREAMLLNGGSFYDYYETADGGYLSIGSLEPQFLKALVEVVGIAEHMMLGFSTKPQDQQRFKKLLAERIRSRPLVSWQRLFADVDACVEPVLSFQQAQQHPQLQARELECELPVGPDAAGRHQGGQERQLRLPLNFSRSPVGSEFVGSKVGAHNNEVLRSCGWGDEAIAALTRE